MLIRLAIRNLLRQRIRTTMTLTAIIFGVAGLIVSGGFVQDIYVQLGESIIHSQTGHVQVFRKDFREKGTRQPENYLIPQPDALATKIATLPEVKEVSMRLSFAGTLNNGRRDLGIVGEGIEPDKEARLGTALEILSGRQLRDDDLFGAVIGQGVAHSMSLEVGDQIVLVLNTAEGAVNTLDFELVGIFQSFSKEFDARAVRIPLAAARELLYTDGANMLVTTLRRTEDTSRAYAAISALLDPARFEAFDWKMLSDFYEKTLGLYQRQFGVLQGIILVMVLLSVTNSVNMAAFERQAEFGTMQALGNARQTIFRLLIVENVALGLAGALLGCVIGIMLALLISAVGIPMPPPPNANIGYTAMIRIVPSVVAGAFAIGLVATTLAAIFPARRVGTTPIVELLRQGN